MSEVVRRDLELLLRMHEREVQILQWVFADLDQLIRQERGSDPVTERLFPRAYLDPTEEQAEADWQALAHEDLVASRTTALRAVEHALESAARAPGGMCEVVLDDEHAEQWLNVINDARLAIGISLGVTADSDLDELDPAAPDFELHALYDWLTYLLGSLLGGLSGPDDDGDVAADGE